MSERTAATQRSFRAVLLALLLASPASAQRPQVEYLSPQIDSLGAELLAAERALDSARALAQAERIASAQTSLDTQLVGPVTVISRPAIADLARLATQHALARFGGLPRDSASPLRAQTLLIEYGGSVPEFEVMAAHERHEIVSLPTLAAPGHLANAVERKLAWRLAQLLPEDVRTWAGGGVSFEPDRSVLTGVYRELAISNSTASARCRRGVIAGCAAALALTGPGDFWSDWYPEAEVLAWARAQPPYVRRRFAEFVPCFEQRVAEACAAMMARDRGPRAPLSTNARLTLLAVALERGDVSGFRVLQHDTSGSVLDRLARAADMPADDLLREWHRRVDEARPRQVAGLNGTWIATLLWAALLCAIAMRSTRWRLG